MIKAHLSTRSNPNYSVIVLVLEGSNGHARKKPITFPGGKLHLRFSVVLTTRSPFANLAELWNSVELLILSCGI